MKNCGKTRWCYGDINSIIVPVDSGVVILPGDILFVCDERVVPADLYRIAYESYATKGDMYGAGQFLGVAMQGSMRENQWIRIATTGVFEFELRKGSLGKIPGNPVGVWFGDCRSCDVTTDMDYIDGITLIGVVAATNAVPEGKCMVDISSDYYCRP